MAPIDPRDFGRLDNTAGGWRAMVAEPVAETFRDLLAVTDEIQQSVFIDSMVDIPVVSARLAGGSHA